jgi:hypothetical protein
MSSWRDRRPSCFTSAGSARNEAGCSSRLRSADAPRAALSIPVRFPAMRDGQRPPGRRASCCLSSRLEPVSAQRISALRDHLRCSASPRQTFSSTTSILAMVRSSSFVMAMAPKYRLLNRFGRPFRSRERRIAGNTRAMIWASGAIDCPLPDIVFIFLQGRDQRGKARPLRSKPWRAAEQSVRQACFDRKRGSSKRTLRFAHLRTAN